MIAKSLEEVEALVNANGVIDCGDLMHKYGHEGYAKAQALLEANGWVYNIGIDALEKRSRGQ